MSIQTETQEVPEEVPEVKIEIDPLVEQLNSVTALLEVLNKTSKSLSLEMKTLTKDVNKLRVSKRSKTKKVIDPNVPRKISALEKPVEITSELSEFLGLTVGEFQSRQFITKEINKYVKEHDIQNPDNRRYILLDSKDEGRKLGKLLRDPDQPLTFFNIQRYLKVHYVPSETKTEPKSKGKKVVDTSEAPASEAPASEAPASEAPASEAPASEAPKKKVIRRVVKKST